MLISNIAMSGYVPAYKKKKLSYVINLELCHDTCTTTKKLANSTTGHLCSPEFFAYMPLTCRKHEVVSFVLFIW